MEPAEQRETASDELWMDGSEPSRAAYIMAQPAEEEPAVEEATIPAEVLCRLHFTSFAA